MLFDLRKSLVWRKQRGHFERQNQRKRFYHIFLTSSSFVCSVTNWLLRFYPLFFAARSKGKRTSEILARIAQTAYRGNSSCLLVQENCSYKLGFP